MPPSIGKLPIRIDKRSLTWTNPRQLRMEVLTAENPGSGNMWVLKKSVIEMSFPLPVIVAAKFARSTAKGRLP